VAPLGGDGVGRYMLNRIEQKIMDLFYEKCASKKTVLFSPAELQEHLAPKHELTFKEIEIMVKNLMVDGYIDVYHSDNKGTLNYVVGLKARGEGYRREREDAKAKRVRSIGWKVFLTVLGVILAGILTRILWG